MAPEAIQKKRYSEQSDSYAFGVYIWEVRWVFSRSSSLTLVQLMHRQEPFHDVEVFECGAGVVCRLRVVQRGRGSDGRRLGVDSPRDCRRRASRCGLWRRRQLSFVDRLLLASVLVDLMNDCWERDVSKRPLFDNIVDRLTAGASPLLRLSCAQRACL